MRRIGTLFAIAATATLGLAACGGADTSSSSPTSSTSSSSSSSSTSSSPSMTSSSPAMAMDGPVGPGCADYAAANASGPASVEGMAQAPLASAAAANPLLKTLTAAVSGQLNPQVNLVNDLNGGEFTVFAPVDDAFAKVPAATLDGLKTDSATLQKILTYHVVQGRLSPSEVVGTHTTLEGQDVTVAGTPDALTVNGSTNVICGGVSTANATVYLVDSVLMPPM
ncbi:fasciclin domain-containing protein [Kineococcus aurantiacus]|uniref:Putative surface protein with fasciclin (FAS1) repeats n=1 Tax=Kineococcus aurantiacus TaxID=37633 RepID=A0A7Y9DMY0_9ACTN|nr:fasciclin domain-containing protein [Kineococcus aurantiacus]NYD23583.1 putative surface protein with fasciclin (FAS1) repeats [Kineococcus aurantiacus]